MTFLIILSVVVGVLIIIGIIVGIVIPVIIANSFLYPKRQPMVKNPADYGLKYEDVQIKTKDGVTLAAWLIRGTGKGVIILGHPGTFTRYGYSLKHESIMKSRYNRDVEFIPTAKHLVDAGYTVLMYDQRNHGESGSTPNGAPHDLPKNVYLDAVAVAKYVSEHPDFAGKAIGLLAICMNSMINMIAMTKEPEEMRKANIKAMTVIQPHGIDLFFKNFGIPNFIINRANQIYKKKGATEMAGWDPVPFAKNIFVPVLFVQNVNDPWSDMDHVREIYNAIPTEKTAIWIDEEEEKHRFHTYNWFNDNPEKLLQFFNKYLN
jgi:alpha-beta hydrolase superfamily lysophospholipase